MDPVTIVAPIALALCTVLLATAAASETALERASDVRIQALAARGDERARRIAGSVEQPRQFLGPLTAARILFAAAIVAIAAYLGAREYSPLAGAIGFGLLGGVAVELIEMTVGLIVARQPEVAALNLSGVARMYGIVFSVPAFLLSLPSRFIARSLSVVTPRSDLDILALVEREEAAGGVEEQERRMIRGIIALEDKTAREIMVPRIDMAAADIEDGVNEVATIVNERGFSR